jgi:gliding motility-associated-like protein
MMVVNASTLSTAGIFYTKTVTDLCPGTTYEFSAWLMNLMTFTSPNPNVTFTVSTTTGTVLGTYNTGELAVTSSGTWKQFGFYFTTGTASTVVITILNNAVGAAPGNDLALDDITFRACGPTVTTTITDESTTTLEICENEPQSITLSGSITSAAYTTAGYQWQSSTDNGVTWTDIAGATTQDYTFTTAAVGTTLYRLATAENSNIGSTNCRVYSNEITVTVTTSPVLATIDVVQPSCDVPTGTITVTAPLNGSYSIDGINFQSSPIFSGLAGGSYTVTTQSGLCTGAVKMATINSVATTNATPTATVVQPVVCNDPYGTITVTTVDAEYSFDNGVTWQVSPVKANAAVGDYSVKTRNSSLCETTALVVTIDNPPGFPPTPTVTVVQPDCVIATGSITVSDVAAAYSFDGGANWGTANSISAISAGTYLVLLQNTLGCVSLVASEVVIADYSNNEPLPTVNSTQAFCIQELKTLADIVISGTAIKWYDSAVGGNELPSTTVLTTATYYASQTLSLCESERIAVAVTVQNTAAPTGASAKSFCSTQNATVADLDAVGTDIIWYDAITGGVVLSSTDALVDSQTYYSSQTISGCESMLRLSVTVMITSPSLVLTDVDAAFCDVLDDGSEAVDLSAYATTITTDATAVLSYYTTLLDAENQSATNEIVNPSSYTLGIGTTTLYARVDSADLCYQIATLTLTVYEAPQIAVADQVAICESSSTTLDAGSGFASYLWSTGETTQVITITTIGSYWVTVTQNNVTITCSATQYFEAIASNVATISTVDVVDWTDNQNSITVHLESSSIGDYEYSLDNYTYQDSNVFTNLISGLYTVYVRDKNGCGSTTQEVYILNYPKFSTPNGDGYNDTWSVQLGETDTELTTEIFDRYGKLLKVLNATSSWDGTYNGYQMPSTDYWFVVHRSNGKVYKGHFAMKR